MRWVGSTGGICDKANHHDKPAPMSKPAIVRYHACIGSLYSIDAAQFLQKLADESVDLIVTSPPYFIGKEYDTSKSVADFEREIARLLSELVRVLKPGASLCWQIGSHVVGGNFVPLDALIYASHRSQPLLNLRNRIVWTFDHGVHVKRRFSGRHETVLWYTKGSDYFFDLDAVRVAQKYPGKRYYKGPKKGEWSGNPLGKNPGDVWAIPNVKAKHVEKTEHPCQFPVALARRLILSLCPLNGIVVDPYMGAGTTGFAALLTGRNFKGTDVNKNYVDIAKTRLRGLAAGSAAYREDKPIRPPGLTEAVAQRPSHFANHQGELHE